MKDVKLYAQELRPFKTIEGRWAFLLRWFLLVALFTLPALYYLPHRPDESLVMASPLFHLENILWFSLSALSALSLYENSFPDGRTNKYVGALIVILLCLFISALNHSASLASQDLKTELEVHRGNCGAIISFLSIFIGSYLINWAKHGATYHPRRSGLFASLSGSALGCFLMQVICVQDNSLHIILWHFIPLTLLCFCAQYLTNKILRW